MRALLPVVVGFFFLGVDAADLTFNGLSLIALVLIVLGLWVGGAFNRVWAVRHTNAARVARSTDSATSSNGDTQ